MGTLEALCRTIVPSAFTRVETSDLPDLIQERIAELTPFHRRRALLALRLFDSRFLSLMLVARPVAFARLSEPMRELMLTRCAEHNSASIRLLFSSIRRLVLHTHYGRAEVRSEIGHKGPLHARAAVFEWEGALPDAPPVVAQTTRPIARERNLPPGVTETLPADTNVRTRVCIIGSGVGGAMTAAIVAEAGHDVVVLEEGGYYSAADFGDDETAALQTLYADSGLRSTDQLNVSILQGRCVGGGSTVNWMVMLRTPDWVLEEWQRKHGSEDMSVADMRAEFDAFEKSCNVGRVGQRAHSRINRLILNSAESLGWSAHGARVNARDCMRSGACGLGCRYDAKQSAVVSQLPRALAAGAKLYCNARVKSIARKGAGFVVRAREGVSDLTVNADVVVVAAGAVGTPTLLQRSGLACEGVGKHLRLHPTTAVVGVYDTPFYAATGIPLTAYCDEHVHLHGNYGHWIEAPPLTAGLAAVALPGFGRAHRDYMQRFPYLAPLIVLVRDGAPAGPSVGTVAARGAHARIRYQLGATDRRTMLHGIESAARMHLEAGATSVLTLHGQETVLRTDADLWKIADVNSRFGDPSLFSAHVNGTCRIGLAARTSGCRPDGQVHGQKGLYVMDGSLLPTAPGVNPHETIAAVTSILARKLAATL